LATVPSDEGKRDNMKTPSERSRPQRNHVGVRSIGGLRGTLLGSLHPVGPAVGLMSALATGGIAQAAQDPAAAQASAGDAPLVLPTVHVQGKADSYKTDQTAITRVATPLVNTPQQVAVVPRQVMEEQSATTVAQALRNVSGITMSAGEGGRQGDTFILRGFSGQNDVFRDGSRDLGWYTRDTFNLENVEVFFGPSAVVFGRGSTGGAVNLVTKSPKKGTFSELKLAGGSAPQGRIEGDVNHAFSDNIQVRASAMGQMGGVAGRDKVEANRAGFAPSARFVLGEHTILGLDYLYQRERGIPDYGVPFVNGAPVSNSLGIPRNTFYGVADSDKEEVDAHIATARIQHEFSPSIQLSNSFRWGRVDRLARPTAPSNVVPAASPTTLDRQRFETETDNINSINQTDLRLTFASGTFKHQANVGLELSYEKRKQTRYNFGVPNASGALGNMTTDLRNPDPSPNLSAVGTAFSSYSRGLMLSGAVYASDQIAIGEQFELLGSLRFDSFGTEYRGINAAGVVTEFDQRDGLLDYRGGLVVHPIDKTSLYAMVGSSSNPSAEAGTLSTGTASLDPEKNIVYELGAKADLAGDRLGVGGSVFRVEKNNARIPGLDPTQPLQILEGKQRVQGANIGGAGTILPGWKLYGSYTLLRSRIRRHTSDFLIGQPLPNTPPHALSLWTTYSPIERLSLGGGASFQSETVVNNPATAAAVLNKVPSYWRFDVFASYGISNYDLQVNLSNLTNALYYTQLSGSRAVPAEGRMVMVTARVRL
jgi:catecholate siderophore receptor